MKCEHYEVMGMRSHGRKGAMSYYYQARNNVSIIGCIYVHVIRLIFEHLVLSFYVCWVSVSAWVGHCEN